MKRPLSVAVTVIALSVGLMAGCGSEASPSGDAAAASAESNGVGDLPADEALKKVQAAVADATSVHFEGSVRDASQTIDLDVTAEIEGDATADLTVNGQQLQVLVVGDTGYVKADAEIWEQQLGARVATLINDRWIKFPKDSADFASFVSLVDPTSYLEQDKPETLEQGDATTINDVPVFALVDPSASEGGTLYAASTGQPLPVRLIGGDQSSGGEVDFDEWNEPITVTAPDPADVIDPTTIK